MDLHNLLFLICFNLLYPREVVLLRGNNEEITKNQHIAFSALVLKHFGQDILNEFNAFFAKLPLAHFVDSPHKKIFAVHGGIPVKFEDATKGITFRKLSYRSFKESIADMDSVAQQFLLNQPNDHLPRGKLFQTLPDGIGAEFGKRVFSDFMRKNKVDLFVRGDLTNPEGYEFKWDNRLLSLVSITELNSNPIKGKFCEVLFPPDPEYPEDLPEGAENEGEDEFEEEELAEGEESDEFIDTSEDVASDEQFMNPTEDQENLTETAIHLVDIDTL